MEKRVVVTGVGILASNGIGRDAFWKALEQGKTGFKPVTLFDAAGLSVNTAGEITEFEPTQFLGSKGLRTLDRSTKLICSAAKLAIDDSKLEISEENTQEIGVSVGTTLGSVYSISEFDKQALREGPRSVNPMLFPNTVINSPGSQVSIRFNIKGFNTTISTGFTASLDSLSYATDFIKWGRVGIVFAGGVEELCLQTFLGFYKLKFLSGSKDDEQFISCPFDKRRNGIVFGEGAGFLALESLESAQKRNANILAEIGGFGFSFDPFRINKYNPRGTGLKEAMRFALENSKVSLGDIDCIFANANSTVAADKIETEAIKEIFGKQAYKIPVTAIKSMTGEGFSVSGIIEAISAVGAIHNGFIPSTVNYQEKDDSCDLDYVPGASRKAKLKNVMVITFGPSGSNTVMILKGFK